MTKHAAESKYMLQKDTQTESKHVKQKKNLKNRTK